MIRLTFLITLAISFSSISEAALDWQLDYPQAIEKSLEDKKPILLFFTGSDWSGLAMKMKNEVLDSAQFQEKIHSHFHCVQVDFPRYFPLPSEKEAQNLALKARFQVEEYPLLILLDASEREITRIGYVPKSGELLATELMQIVSQDAELMVGLDKMPSDEQALDHLYQLAQTLSRTEAQEKILSAGVDAQVPFFMLEQYRFLVEKGQDADHLKQKLLESKDHQVHFTLAMIDFQQRASTMQDPLEVIKPLESYLEHFKDQDTQNVWRIEMMLAQFYLDTDDWKKALEHAETAYEAAPGAMQDQIENSLMYIRDQIR